MLYECLIVGLKDIYIHIFLCKLFVSDPDFISLFVWLVFLSFCEVNTSIVVCVFFSINTFYLE